MTHQFLNTLYVLTPDAHVRIDHDAYRVEVDGAKLMQVPAQHIGAIYLFGNATISGQAIHRSAEEGRAVVYFDYAGRFKARVVGPVCGNVLLRQAQHDVIRDDTNRLSIAAAIVAGKCQNAYRSLMRGVRDTGDENRAGLLREAARQIGELITTLPERPNVDAIRGIEGQAAALYFDVFGELLNVPAEEFSFRTRTRRPPRDRVNCLISFLYALLQSDCTAACEGVGLDPQFGFLHEIRPGRPALALDLMEEFRPILADRLAVTLINRRQIAATDFAVRQGAGDSVTLTADGRKTVVAAYQRRKQEEVTHAVLKSRAPLGLAPHLQARLLARRLRGDMESYVPFIL